MNATWDRGRYVSFRLPLLLSHHVGDCPRRSEIVDGASDINCQQHDRLRNRLSHVSVWLYSSKSDLHLCIRIQHPILDQADSHAPDLRRILGRSDQPSLELLCGEPAFRGYRLSASGRLLRNAGITATPFFSSLLADLVHAYSWTKQSRDSHETVVEPR